VAFCMQNSAKWIIQGPRWVIHRRAGGLGESGRHQHFGLNYASCRIAFREWIVSPAPPIPELIKLLRNDSQSALKGGHKEVFIARAPGRLDVMGGIADYAGSLVCELPLESGAAVAVQRRDDRKIRIKTYSSASAAGGRADTGGAGVEDTVELSLDDFYGTAA